ncbi:MAG: aldehyde dehydrogenase family protein [Actinomycetales bacterium]|nr:aldehyde dehydrogenase family protein [Actinomycetales bacterium]
MIEVGNYIGGAHAAGLGTLSLTSSAPDSGDPLATLVDSREADVDAAVGAARRALRGEWGRWTPMQRNALLTRVADLVDERYDELARLDSQEYGGPITRTRANRARVVGLLRYYAGLALQLEGHTVNVSTPGDHHVFTTRQPAGVVAAIVPWNGPIGSLIWKVAPALAAGCTVVAKPSEYSSLSALRVAEYVTEAGAPDGVFNVVTGAAETGRILVGHEGVDHIAFTGSSNAGKAIAATAGAQLKTYTLELGGKSANIVFADADLGAAARGSVAAAFQNSGQICSAGSRLFVHESIVDEFLERMNRQIAGMRVGFSLDETTDFGPLATAAQAATVDTLLEGAVAQGARIHRFDVRVDERLHREMGNFRLPVALVETTDDMAVNRREIFGPVVSVLPFSSEEEVIERSNAGDFGLAAGLWTSDVDRALRVSRALEAGTVWVNCWQNLDVAAPFGGVKDSGVGRESGVEHILSFTRTKTTWMAFRG